MRGIILASIAFAYARQLVRDRPAPKTPEGGQKIAQQTESNIVLSER